MSSKHIRGDANFAYPTAEIAVMGPDGAVNILVQARDGSRGETRPGSRKRKTLEYREEVRQPYVRPSAGTSTKVIEPPRHPARLIQALEVLHTSATPTRRASTEHAPVMAPS